MGNVQFSKRIPQAQRENPLAAELEGRDSRRPLFNLTISNPTVAGVAPPLSPLLSEIEAQQLETYAPKPLGLESARVALARALSEDRNQDISPDNLVLLSSTSEAYGLLFRILGSPGDTLWAPTPSYPLFDQIAQLESLQIQKYDLLFGGGDWCLDRSRIDLTPNAENRSCAVLSVHPNNPTGSYLSVVEAKYLEELCEGAGVPLIVDEVFYEYALERQADHAPSFLKPTSTPTLVLGGMSKAFCLPQLKLAWIYLGGETSFQTRIRGALEYASDAYLSLSNAAQALLPLLLPQRHEIQKRVLQRLKENLRHLQAATAGTAVTALPVSGGWYAIASLPPTRTDLEWALQLLKCDDVLTHPGFLYDFPNEARLVLSLLSPTEDFQEGLGRLIRRVHRDL